MARRERNKAPALSDWHLWSEVTRSISPLRPEAKKPKLAVKTAPPPIKAPEPKKVWAPLANQTRLAPPQQPMPIPTRPQMVAGRVIEPGLKRKLVRGRLPIDATIDLHGLRHSEAHAALCRFIAARHAYGDRTVLVITGKGRKANSHGNLEHRGVLRAMLPVWLSEPALSPMIGGWETSAQSHGGEGAYYVRLKRNGK